MFEIIEQVRATLIKAIDEDQLCLPTLPEVALNVRETAQDPDASVASLCQVIEFDAALTGRIIKVANSPLFRGSKATENLRMAVVRLGISYSANLATGLAMKQMFQATTDRVDKLLRQTWLKSTEVAGFAQILAKQCKPLQPDKASLAGLTHRIGVLPILTYAEENRTLLADESVLNAVIEAIHPDIGNRILTAWDFPEELAQVPLNYLNFDREASTGDYTDLITVSALHNAKNSQHPLAAVNLQEVAAFDRLKLSRGMPEEENSELIEHIELAVAAMD